MSCALSASICAPDSGRRDRDFGARHALGGVIELVEALDHVADREQAALLRDKLEEIGGDAGNAGLGENGDQRLDLRVAREHRALHQALHIGRSGDEIAESLQIRRDRVGRLGFLRQREKSGRVASRHAGYERFFLSHSRASASWRLRESRPRGANIRNSPENQARK
jgi:hypothetical protein